MIIQTRCEKNPEWRQDTPREQIVGLIGAMTGHALVLADKFVTEPIEVVANAQQIRDRGKQALDILRNWPDLSTWERSSVSDGVSGGAADREGELRYPGGGFSGV